MIKPLKIIKKNVTRIEKKVEQYQGHTQNPSIFLLHLETL